MKKLLLAILKWFRIGTSTGAKYLNDLVTLQQDCELCLDSLKKRHESLKETYLNVETTHQKYISRLESLSKELKNLDFAIIQAVKNGLDAQATHLIKDKQRKDRQEETLKLNIENLSERLRDFQLELDKSCEDRHQVEFELSNLQLEYDVAQANIELYNDSNNPSMASLTSIRERVEAATSRSKAIKVMEANNTENVKQEVNTIVNDISTQDILAQYKQKVLEIK